MLNLEQAMLNLEGAGARGGFYSGGFSLSIFMKGLFLIQLGAGVSQFEKLP